MFANLAADYRRNLMTPARLCKSLIVPDCFNALLGLRLFIWLEKHRLPVFLPYRWLLHMHGLEMAKRCRIGPGLSLPHPRGVLFTEETVIGTGCSIYGNVRFTRKDGRTPVVGDRVFIGDGVILLGTAVVGTGTTVGAGAIVTKAFGEDLVIAGNPARVIRQKSAAAPAPETPQPEGAVPEKRMP
jgi:serine O-acetyltransferase